MLGGLAGRGTTSGKPVATGYQRDGMARKSARSAGHRDRGGRPKPRERRNAGRIDPNEAS